ncbi:uncharacterized protein LOC111060057 [Nilaparvata lugens]|uniref:uncharacterized protein LOC111060057 n=1 Tax=Nilaparvata lugens TaxID=108931 RepID=UPI00193D1404|nr:uncharacterized protein LOC111060057 [Nilaparvata lugens]
MSLRPSRDPDLLDLIRSLKEIPSYWDPLHQELQEVEWSDAIFNSKYLLPNRYKQRASQNCAISAARFFLNWYIGRSTTNEHLLNAFLALASYARYDGVHVISDKCFSAEAAEGRCFTDFPEVTKLTTVSVSYSTGAKHIQIKHSRQRVDANTTKDWYDKLWNVIDADPGQDRQQVAKLNEVLNYLFFVSLNTFRLLQKPIGSLENHIPAFVTDKFVYFWSPTSNLFSEPTPPPISTGEGTNNYGFNRNFNNSITYLAWLVESYISPKSQHRQLVQGILNAGCLMTFAGTGIGLIHWLKEAAKAHSMSEEILIQYFEVDIFQTAVDAVKKFLQNVDKKQQTWPWARIFCDGAYYSLSIRKYPDLAVALATCKSNARQTDPMWNYAQFKDVKRGISFERDVEYGRSVYKLISKINRQNR